MSPWLPVTILHDSVKSGGIGLVEEEILSFKFDTWPLLITWSEWCDFFMGFASPYVSTLQNFVVIWFHGCVYLTISHQLANFHGHRPWQRGYVTLIINTWPHNTSLSVHHVTLMWSHDQRKIMSTHFKSPSWQVWWLQASCKRRYFVFSLSSDLMWLRGERDTWHYGGVSLVISEYHANFDGHRPFGRGEIKLSICHVTSHNRGTRRSCDIMSEITLSQVAPLLSLVVTGFVE